VIVIDASAVIEWLLRTTTGDRVEARMFARAVHVHTPHVLDIEVAQALRRQVRMRLLDDRRAAEALDDLADLAFVRHPHDVLLGRVWELRHNLTAYDAAYVALAEAVHAPLITCDAKLKLARGHRARIELI
jgi:predicted nucleic acid-binding protein